MSLIRFHNGTRSPRELKSAQPAPQHNSCASALTVFSGCQAPPQSQLQARKVERITVRNQRPARLQIPGVREQTESPLVSTPRQIKPSPYRQCIEAAFTNQRTDQGWLTLEHMLFIGTGKYPEVDSFQQYITANGGSSNAYTAQDHTNYFFDIQNSAFNEGWIDLVISLPTLCCLQNMWIQKNAYRVPNADQR